MKKYREREREKERERERERETYRLLTPLSTKNSNAIKQHASVLCIIRKLLIQDYVIVVIGRLKFRLSKIRCKVAGRAILLELYYCDSVFPLKPYISYDNILTTLGIIHYR